MPQRPQGLLLFGGFGVEGAGSTFGAADGGVADAGVVAIVEAAEDHFAGGRLMHGGDEDVDGFVDEAASAVDYDHGAVFEIGYALIDLLAFAQDEDAHAFTGKDGRTQSVRKKIDVEDADTLNAGDLVEIEIVGDDLGLKAEGEFD